jgi:hypothetical protein
MVADHQGGWHQGRVALAQSRWRNGRGDCGRNSRLPPRRDRRAAVRHQKRTRHATNANDLKQELSKINEPRGGEVDVIRLLPERAVAPGVLCHGAPPAAAAAQTFIHVARRVRRHPNSAWRAARHRCCAWRYAAPSAQRPRPAPQRRPRRREPGHQSPARDHAPGPSYRRNRARSLRRHPRRARVRSRPGWPGALVSPALRARAPARWRPAPARNAPQGHI